MRIPAAGVVLSTLLIVPATYAAAAPPPPTSAPTPPATTAPSQPDAAPAEPAKEEAAADEAPAVEVHGQFGFGLRFFLDRPLPRERWKFERYGEVPSGLYLQDAFVEAVTKDGYVASFWATHPGLNNQNFLLQLADPGNLYLTFEFDQTPSLASTSARTLFDTSNPGTNTINDEIQAGLEAANKNDRNEIVNANVRPVSVNIDRDTAKASFRYTPAPEWNIRFDYSHEERNGKQIFGAPINEFNAIETLAPVAYTTQNVSANVEYAGKWADDKKFSAALGYAGSLFENKFLSFTWDNPFRLTPPSGENSANQGRNSLPPDNQAHRLNFTGAIDLPFDTRYTTTFSYNRMTQNSPFIPFTINPAINGDCPFPLSDVRCLPARSLNGEIDEKLFNNVLTTRFDSDLTTTLRYRYLSLDNKSPEILFKEWVQWDGEKADDSVRSRAPAYDKTNASADVNWAFMPGWKVGGSLGWEHFDRKDADVKQTNEYSEKIFVDVKPQDWAWLNVRASALHAERDFDSYHYLSVGEGSSSMRRFDMAKRSRNKVDIFTEFSFDDGTVITPSAAWRHDDFGDHRADGGELGLKQEGYWNVGLEHSMPVTDEITLTTSYMHEVYDRRMVNGGGDSGGGGGGGGSGGSGKSGPGGSGDSGGGGGGGGGGNLWGSRIHDNVDTLDSAVTIALADKLLPGNLDLELGYLFTHTNNATDTYALGGGETPDQFPDVKNAFHRLSATLKYDVDPDLVTAIGWEGEAKLKLRYAYERNHMTNWQSDIVTPYMGLVDDEAENSLFLDAFDSNYKASLITMELGLTW